MRLKSFILGCALAIAPSLPAVAQPATQAPGQQTAPARIDARPALWVVKDKDTTIYLFGTIHLLKPEIDWFKGPIRNAFDSAQQIVLEVADGNKAAQQGMLLQRALQPEGPSLSSQLAEPARTKYLKTLEEHGVSPLLFDHVKPWFATLTLAVLPLQKSGYDPASGADRQIELAALPAGKTLTGLETTEEQIGFFEDMPQPLQLELLSQTLDELPVLMSTIKQMIDAWCAGEPEKLAALMNESTDSNPELEKRLLTDRNIRWADWIAARLRQPGTVFMAVGAGHLAGPNSVQQQLKARRIRARLVPRDD